MDRKLGLPLDRAIAAAERLVQELTNLVAIGMGDKRIAYMGFVDSATAYLGDAFERASVEHFLLTDRYWEIARSVSPAPDARIYFPEVDARRRDGEELLSQLRGTNARLSPHLGSFLVLDTNMFLHCQYFREVQWAELTDPEPARIAIPSVVIEELDTLRWSARAERVRRTSRTVLRDLERVFASGDGPVSIDERVTVEIIIDPAKHIRASTPDEEIIRCCLFLQDVCGRATLITEDLAMRLRGRMMGATVRRAPESWRLKEGASDS